MTVNEDALSPAQIAVNAGLEERRLEDVWRERVKNTLKIGLPAILLILGIIYRKEILNILQMGIDLTIHKNGATFGN